ncbi:hypothetical protein C4D60_Mb04t39500 [Musa balbisiana]|uniref:Uncharacterized protein n=1 Tax=Musa balbisiana TaxID=52838 RepID=A0A4S8KIT6_MUSBA|nr:hypothetical protein C4D60_Mb04t39500 [Musa balbisiana]
MFPLGKDCNLEMALAANLYDFSAPAAITVPRSSEIGRDFGHPSRLSRPPTAPCWGRHAVPSPASQAHSRCRQFNYGKRLVFDGQQTPKRLNELLVLHCLEVGGDCRGRHATAVGATQPVGGADGGGIIERPIGVLKVGMELGIQAGLGDHMSAVLGARTKLLLE